MPGPEYEGGGGGSDPEDEEFPEYVRGGMKGTKFATVQSLEKAFSNIKPLPSDWLEKCIWAPTVDNELPPGWETRLSDTGRAYYVDHNTRTTTFKHPGPNPTALPDDLDEHELERKSTAARKHFAKDLRQAEDGDARMQSNVSASFSTSFSTRNKFNGILKFPAGDFMYKERSMMWKLKASAQGDPISTADLAKHFLQGNGVCVQDSDLAITLFEQAIKAANTDTFGMSQAQKVWLDNQLVLAQTDAAERMRDELLSYTAGDQQKMVAACYHELWLADMAGNDAAAEALFAKLQAQCQAEITKLGKITRSRQRAIKLSTDFQRHINTIASFEDDNCHPLVERWVSDPNQLFAIKAHEEERKQHPKKKKKVKAKMSSNKELREKEYIRRTRQAFHFASPAIHTILEDMLHVFNNTPSPTDLGVSANTFPRTLETSDQIEGAAVFAKLKFGELKSEARMFAKVVEYYFDKSKEFAPFARYVIDVDRCTFEFTSSYAMGLFYAYLAADPRIEVVRVKNKLTDASIPEEVQTNILINARVVIAERAYIFEIQLTFTDFLVIKKALHKFYKGARAAVALDLFDYGPNFLA